MESLEDIDTTEARTALEEVVTDVRAAEEAKTKRIAARRDPWFKLREKLKLNKIRRPYLIIFALVAALGTADYFIPEVKQSISNSFDNLVGSFYRNQPTESRDIYQKPENENQNHRPIR